MNAQPNRHLKPVADEVPLIVVNPETGERMGMLADHTQRLEDEIAGLQRDIRGWAARYGDLRRDKDAEAKESPVWPAAVRVFEYWRRQTGKTKRTVFTLDRFELVRPWLEKLGDPKAEPAKRLEEAEALCKLAVDGIAFDHYVEKAKNGTDRHHVGFHLIFKEADQFEKRCNSAPRERLDEVLRGRSIKQAMAGKKLEGQAQLDQPQA
jgi:hypothetical protein